MQCASHGTMNPPNTKVPAPNRAPMMASGPQRRGPGGAPVMDIFSIRWVASSTIPVKVLVAGNTAHPSAAAKPSTESTCSEPATKHVISTLMLLMLETARPTLQQQQQAVLRSSNVATPKDGHHSRKYSHWFTPEMMHVPGTSGDLHVGAFQRYYANGWGERKTCTILRFTGCLPDRPEYRFLTTLGTIHKLMKAAAAQKACE